MKNIMINVTELEALLLSIFLMLFITSCAGPTVNQAIKDANDPEMVNKFEREIMVIAKIASEDPNYKRIPLDSKADQTWFTSLAFLLWDKKTTKDGFVKEGLTRFPDYKRSFEYIAEKVNAFK